MALTHHFIVQLAASRVGIVGWFSEYALLGDDIVIANSAVAKVYHQLMTTVLGVEINLAKSLFSEKGVFEYAKRLVGPDGEYSPIGPANVLWSIRSFSMIPSLFLDRRNKGEDITDTIVNDCFSSSFPICKKLQQGTRWEDLKWTILGPFGFVRTTGLTPSIGVVNLTVELAGALRYGCMTALLRLRTRE